MDDVIPCRQNQELNDQVKRFAETLRSEAHLLGNHGLSEEEFYQSGIFRGAIERLRGQFSALTRDKRDFAKQVLNFLEDGEHIKGWDVTFDANRNDYSVKLPSGRCAVIAVKGCLDGNNTTIFERPDSADEFLLWSMCTNPGADPRKNVWSGIHTRLSAEMILRSQRVDGIIVWDSMCGTRLRPCPKIDPRHGLLEIGSLRVPPPCIYVLPASLPTPDSPKAEAQSLEQVELLSTFQRCFQAEADSVKYVDFQLAIRGEEMTRQTTLRSVIGSIKVSKMTGINRV